MSNRFIAEWGKSLFVWACFVFTVLGCAMALVLARESWWISLLIVATNFLAATGFAYKANQRAKELVSSEREIRNQLQIAEQKLNEIPFDILIQLKTFFDEYSRDQLLKILADHAEFVSRMIGLTQENAKPLNLRTFMKQGEYFFAVAKVSSSALNFIRIGDLFFLVRKHSTGVETVSAELIVHQPPDKAKETIVLRIERYMGDEMGHIAGLAAVQDVEGIKGFTIRPACALEQYRAINIQDVGKAIMLLANDIENRRSNSRD